MSFKKLISKILSWAMIGTGIYQILYSIFLMFFVYPHYQGSSEINPEIIGRSLLEKGIVMYLSLILNTTLGLALLFTPEHKLRFYQIFIGVLLLGLTLFYVTSTPLTTNPIWEPTKNLLHLR